MPTTMDANERLVCAILAAQAAAVRDRAETGPSVDLLWRTTDVLSRLSGLVLDLVRRDPGLAPSLIDQCSEAVEAEAEVSRALDALAFMQAQSQDTTRQWADCVVRGLERFADSPRTALPSLHELAAMYVCEDQQSVHDEAVRRFHAGTAGEHGTGR